MAFTALISLALLVAPAFAAPSGLLSVEKYDGDISGRYIVTLKESASVESTLSKMATHRSAGAMNVTHEWDADFYNGFAGEFDEAALKLIRSNPDVASIAEDGIVHTFATTTQTNAPWGLSRLSSSGPTGGSASSLTFPYTYDTRAGSGVDIYIVDTGIRTTHSAFGGRARWGATFGGYANADGNGHGTHCAGTAASTPYGVAKSASLIAVKVLSDAGSGSFTDIISGLNWVRNQAAASGRPSVASLSLGGGATTTLDTAANNLISSGVHMIVAAGNDNANAANTSPARVAAAITVGASTITDTRASFSNYGAVVDIFAPGQNVISTWSTSDSATNSISGTSMATPHVAGLVAYFISTLGNTTPAAMATRLTSYSQSGVLSGIPSGTVNRLAHNA